MVKELIHDPIFLALPSEDATPDDKAVGQDLLDTLSAHREECVGMAANMIGVRKRILVFYDGDSLHLMYNPKILKKESPYQTEEGCLSLLGEARKTKRYEKIKVEYRDEAFRVRIKTIVGFTAEIIQHEMDHFDGILI